MKNNSQMKYSMKTNKVILLISAGFVLGLEVEFFSWGLSLYERHV